MLTVKRIATFVYGEKSISHSESKAKSGFLLSFTSIWYDHLVQKALCNQSTSFILL